MYRARDLAMKRMQVAVEPPASRAAVTLAQLAASGACGLLLQLVLVVVGLGSVLASSETVFTVVKLCGAAYLVLLGVRSIRNRKELADALTPGALSPHRSRRTLRESFMVGATNPKGLLIFTAVLPEFIVRSAGHTTLQLATLGVICAVVALLSDSTWALASGTARAWFGRSPARLERLSAGGGVAMIALGGVLAAAAESPRPPSQPCADRPFSSSVRMRAPAEARETAPSAPSIAPRTAESMMKTSSTVTSQRSVPATFATLIGCRMSSASSPRRRSSSDPRHESSRASWPSA
jgi:threonine/homoserine/homoserine lactone efflux protein